MTQIIYELIRSKRKSVSLSINKDLTPIVRAPMKMPKGEIDDFVSRHAGWIAKQIERTEKHNQTEVVFSDEEVKELKKRAEAVINERVDYYARLMDVDVAGVKITSAKSRWGSCNYKNSLCFSYRLILLSQRLIDYVVVHELAHIKEKNHSARFYRVVEIYLPDYKERIAELKSQR